MLRGTVCILLYLLATACLLGSVIPWLIGGFIVMAVSGSEINNLRDTEKPKSYTSLSFGDWISGPGQLRLSDHVDIPDGASITRYRVGRDTSLFNEFTYYEADYKLPNGSTLITHASGPKPMFAVRKSTATLSLILLPPVGILLFILAVKLTRSAKTRATTKKSPANI